MKLCLGGKPLKVFVGAGPAIVLVFTVGLAGCRMPLPQGDGILAGDVHELRLLVERLSEKQDSIDRTVKHRLDTIEDKIQFRNELIKTTLSEIENRILEQNKDMSALMSEVLELSFQLETLITKLDMKPSRPSARTSRTLSTTQPGEEAFDEAQRQFNLGRYDEARKEFEQALAQGATGDLAIRSQYWLAESLYRQPDLDAAYDRYTELIIAHNTHNLAWRSLERLAEINDKEGRVDDALHLYGEIIQRNPGYEGIERVKQIVEQLKQSSGEAAAPQTNSPGETRAPAQPADP